jgi:hypothetical protein
MNEWEFDLLEDKPELHHAIAEGVEIRRGDRVRLRPHQGGDIIDVVLAGKIAIIEKIEQDYDGRIHVAVVIEDDPGRDLGLLRQPGHRFFFSLNEIEAI